MLVSSVFFYTLVMLGDIMNIAAFKVFRKTFDAMQNDLKISVSCVTNTQRALQSFFGKFYAIFVVNSSYLVFAFDDIESNFAKKGFGSH
jgi:hypothetical protein